MHAPSSGRIRALVVGTNAATRAALLTYLRDAGIDADAPGGRGFARASRTADAVVVFPDELEPAAVRAALDAARDARPEILILVVTASPRRFAGAARGARVLPKPVFGWTLVDAIRAHVAEAGGEG
jgi:hypothetical protein